MTEQVTLKTNDAPYRVVKKFAAVETKVLDDSMGIVRTVFSVTKNLDRQDDILVPGCFGPAVLKSRPPTVVYGHVWDDISQVLGKTINWQELMPGSPELPPSLFSKGYGGMQADVQFELDVPAGRIAFTHVKNGNLPEWSFAFTVPKGGSEYDEKGVRYVKAIDEVMEISLVLIGANPDTTTVSAKSLELKSALEAAIAESADPEAESAERYLRSVERIREANLIAKTFKAYVIEGEEPPISDAQKAINALIADELSEESAGYDSVAWLSDIATSLTVTPEPTPEPVLETESEPIAEADEEASPALLAYLQGTLQGALMEAAQTTQASAKPHVTATTDDFDGLTSFARMHARRVAG